MYTLRGRSRATGHTLFRRRSRTVRVARVPSPSPCAHLAQRRACGARVGPSVALPPPVPPSPASPCAAVLGAPALPRLTNSLPLPLPLLAGPCRVRQRRHDALRRDHGLLRRAHAELQGARRDLHEMPAGGGGRNCSKRAFSFETRLPNAAVGAAHAHAPCDWRPRGMHDIQCTSSDLDPHALRHARR